MKKAFWDNPNPNKKSQKLGAEGVALAKRMAQKAGRPYPNLVDNARAAKKLRS